MRVRRILTLGPSDEPQWVRVYIGQMGDRWAALICSDDEAPPQSDQLKGIAFFADTAEEAERQAMDYLEMGGTELTKARRTMAKPLDPKELVTL
jgi:hypothetical protein